MKKLATRLSQEDKIENILNSTNSDTYKEAALLSLGGIGVRDAYVLLEKFKNKANNIKFIIHTPYGKKLYVTADGLISQTNGQFSGGWKLLGIQSVKSNYFIPFANITKELIEGMQMTYKNGNPMYTGRDLDHGTTRVWGNTKYHGINYIEFI